MKICFFNHMMNIQTMMKVGGATLVVCAGLMVSSCSTNSAAASAPAPMVVGGALAPLSMAGKTLVLDHSQAQVAQIGASETVGDVFSPAWQSSAKWMTTQEYPYNQWKTSIPFTADVTTTPLNEGGKETHTYQKTSDTEAQVTGRNDYSEDEFYACNMKLKFISPTEAVAQYYYYGVDDMSYFFRNVRVTIK